jgi:hypothetical protein
MDSTQLREIMEAYSEVYSPDEQRILSENVDFVIGFIAESVFNLGYTAEEFIEFLNETEVDDIVEFFVDIYENNLLIESVSSDEFINEQFIALYEYGIFEGKVGDILKAGKDTLRAAGFARDALKSGWKQATKGGGGIKAGIDAAGKRVSRQVNQAQGSLSGAMKNASPLGARTLSNIKSAASGAKAKAGELVNKAKSAVTSRLPGGKPKQLSLDLKSAGMKTPGGIKPPSRSDVVKTGVAGAVGTGIGLASRGGGSAGSQPRRSEKLVGSTGQLKASPGSDKNAKDINKRGGISMAGGGAGFLAKKGDRYVVKQAKPVGADDGIIGKAARAIGLTKQKDRAAESARQKKASANRVSYLKHQGLTQKNQAGYMAKGAKLGGQATGANVLKAHFEMWVDELLEEGYDLSKYTWEGLYEEYLDIISE